MNQSITSHSDSPGECQCRQCLRDRKAEGPGGLPAEFTRMIVCATCGDKRCPHATDHRHACTGSNEHGQKGGAGQSTTPHPAPAELLAARKLSEAQRALREAARALLDVYSEEAAQHAKELTEATKMVGRWEMALLRIAAEK